MRTLFAATLFAACAAATHAFAALPPQVYADAREGAADVIVIEVSNVETTGPMSCAVTGHVLRVERGARYSAHEEVRINVPCLGHSDAQPHPGPAIYQGTQNLRESRYARAYLNGGALALYQFQILTSPDQAPRD
ncbi:MAG: hypothetical protein NVV62_07545 [Terricaulis sp.]|nr:hypothetical protein [Terricaulis sp.]